MSRKKPYKYLKTVNRYIPNPNNTKRETREYYYKIFQRLNTDVEFDPNSTYGKFALGKIKPVLKKFKEKERRVNEAISSLDHHKFDLEKLKSSRNKLRITESEIRSSNYANNQIKSSSPMLFYLIKLGAVLIIATCMGFYLMFDSFIIAISSFIILSILFNYLDDKVFKPKYKSHKESFSSPLKLDSIPTEKDTQVNEFENKIVPLQTHLNKTEVELQKIRLMVRKEIEHLLSDQFIKFVLSPHFYNSTDWKKVREKVLSSTVNSCVLCGSVEDISVDHILPRSKYPWKALEITNTQILCRSCNSSKGNR